MGKCGENVVTFEKRKNFEYPHFGGPYLDQEGSDFKNSTRFVHPMTPGFDPYTKKWGSENFVSPQCSVGSESGS